MSHVNTWITSGNTTYFINCHYLQDGTSTIYVNVRFMHIHEEL